MPIHPSGLGDGPQPHLVPQPQPQDLLDLGHGHLPVAHAPSVNTADAKKSGQATGNNAGGPITGNRLVPSSWQNSPPSGPFPVASDTRPADRSGAVELMLAHELRGQSRSRYTDVGEVELLRGGRRVAECDLIALSRGRLLIAEAKATGALETSSAKRRTAASKRVKIAAAPSCSKPPVSCSTRSTPLHAYGTSSCRRG